MFKVYFVRKNHPDIDIDGYEIVDDPTSANIIIGQPDIETIKKCHDLKWIQTTSAGVDRYLNYFPDNVILTNVSGAFGIIISEYVIGALLNVYRHFDYYYTHDLWQSAGIDRSLFDEKILILGTGDLGSNIAKRLKSFDCKIIGLNTTGKIPSSYFDQCDRLDNLDQYYDSDVIINCLPQTNKTIHLINTDNINKIPTDTIIVNVGRGSFIEAKCIEDDDLHTYILDVFEIEPLPSSSILWKKSNVYITPHISGASFDHDPKTLQRIWDIVFDNLKRYINNDQLTHVIDLKKGY